ncbi:universal stress protein [bacterium]|nr:universal stress protein [bacterium]
MIKKILLAADLGSSTPHLLQHACHLSLQYQAKLLVVHAIEPMGALGRVMLKAFMPPDELTQNSIDTVERQVKSQVIDALTEEYMSGEKGLSLLGEVIVKAGSPLVVINDAITHTESDLLIVGNHSGDDTSGLMGSVASKILQTCKIPVFFVPLASAYSHRQPRAS